MEMSRWRWCKAVWSVFGWLQIRLSRAPAEPSWECGSELQSPRWASTITSVSAEQDGGHWDRAAQPLPSRGLDPESAHTPSSHPIGQQSPEHRKVEQYGHNAPKHWQTCSWARRSNDCWEPSDFIPQLALKKNCHLSSLGVLSKNSHNYLKGTLKYSSFTATHLCEIRFSSQTSGKTNIW